jgi:UDP-N-acetylglucosamine:LPS N-acetylglucosamine transferase
MIEIMKDVALSIAVIGFGLAVLLPAIFNVFQAAGINMFYERNIFINLGWMIAITIATIFYVSYYAVSFYYIWWF